MRPRLFGMIGVIRTNSSDPHTLGLHPHVSWPDFVNPFVLLLLYYTLVALLHKWVHIMDEVCVSTDANLVTMTTNRREYITCSCVFFLGYC